MITLTTLIIAGLLAFALLVASFILPHPASWLATLAMGGVFFLVLLPKYQGQQQALAQGTVIQAEVVDVRQWDRKQQDQLVDYYEIIAQATNPRTGNRQQFVSPPLPADPKPYLHRTVRVTVDWNHPKAYIMDISFLPFKVH